jgi:hypothetical protein
VPRDDPSVEDIPQVALKEVLDFLSDRMESFSVQGEDLCLITREFSSPNGILSEASASVTRP